jgi:hypothetical protein
VYWRIRKRTAVESVKRMAGVDMSTEATEKGWRRNYGERANTTAETAKKKPTVSSVLGVGFSTADQSKRAVRPGIPVITQVEKNI